MIIIYVKFTVIMKINVMFKKLLYLVNNYLTYNNFSTTINVFIQSNVISCIIMFKKSM
jgi:hypothetical protein